MPATINPDQFLDPRWRINNLYTIIDKSGKAVPFRPWDEQQEFLADIHTRNLILKCRQRGFTTLMCIVQLDDCLFNPNVRAAVIAHRIDDAKVIFRDKVKFPFEQLPEQLRERIPAVQDSSDTLTLANNSSFRVSTSARSGTLNWLHVSEYGKICAQFPEKAREIRTGAFPAAENGTITIESTAEGEGGDFHDKSAAAQELVTRGLTPSTKEYKFFFYPWWRAKEYALPKTSVVTSPQDETYFERIEHEAKTSLSQEQRNWWLTTEQQIGGDMKREYPATPKEAFEQALEGAIFADDIAASYKHGRIGPYPIDPTRPVHTFWDLGLFDETAIWFVQDFGAQTRFCGYYENSGELIEHYVRYIKRWAEEHGVVLGKHYLPHDGDRQSLWLANGTMGVMARLGFKPRIVNRISDKIEAIRMGRRKFAQVAFDEIGCKQGLGRLKAYRKEWDERRGVWREHPFHGPESNGADAYLTFAQSGHTPMADRLSAKDQYRQHRDRDDDSEKSWMTA